MPLPAGHSVEFIVIEVWVYSNCNKIASEFLNSVNAYCWYE